MEENSETNCERNYDAVNDYGVQGANPETARAENPHEEREDFLPDCDETKKPYIGQRFDTIDDGVQFYKQYASLGGKGTQSAKQMGPKLLVRTSHQTQTPDDEYQTGWVVRQDVALGGAKMDTMW
nr:protein FAR1-RELATED SEQUENCE 9-like [Ipomoea batatas]